MKSRAGPGGCVNPSALDLEQIIQMGDVVAWPQGMGEPLGLTSQLVEQRSSLPNIEVFLGISFGVPMLPDYAEKWSFRALNAAGQNRRLAAAGALDIIPSPISAVPELIRSGVIKVDVAFIRARRHTDNGYVTTGVVSDYTRALIEGARCVVAEIDERLPMTSHDALTPINSIDYWVEPAHEQVLIPDPVPTPAERAVAACVAEFIPDRATVQVGIGGIPAAVVQALSGHADLGIHSGSLSDAVADLVEGGVITNAYKGIDEGVSVTGCLLGSERLVAFADSNPELAMRSADYTHSLAVMSSIKMLYSINGAIEVDLSGQVNAE